MGMALVERRVQVVNEQGMHARPAAEFVTIASKYQSEIQLGRDDSYVNGKSIMGVMTLAAECGCELVIRAEGPDAEPAATALVELVQRGFGES